MKPKSLFTAGLVAALILALAAGAWAGTGGAPQASITLMNSNAALCHANETAWTIAKSADASLDSNSNANWTVTVTKGATSDNFLTVNGFMAVKNTGTAPATIGNIVVNLQRQRVVKGKTYWISAAADVATAASGDAATSANIVANATQENPSLNAPPNGPGNYTGGAKGSQGTFSETAGSGALEFTDADSNSAWAITPEVSIAPGATLNLIFSARFDNTILGIPAGALVRAEVIVSFGNAGGRGGSGASAQNIDIDGDGTVNNTDEVWVRSVPTRLTLTVPPVKACNDSVLLTDPGVSTTGTVSYLTFSNDGIDTGVEVGSGDPGGTQYVYHPQATGVDPGSEGGDICNAAYLDSVDCSDCSVSVIIGYNPDLTPIYYTFPCCQVINLSASACLHLLPATQVILPGDFCTYIITGEGWNNPNFGGKKLLDNFYTVYSPAPTNTTDHTSSPGGGSVTVGIYPAGFYMTFTAKWVNNGTKQNPNWVVKTAPEYILPYFPDTGSTPGPLTANMVDPTSTASKGLGSNVLALRLNVDFNAAGLLGNDLTFGSLKLCNLAAGVKIGSNWTLTAAQAAALNGLTINQILADANVALGGGARPGYVGPESDPNAAKKEYENLVALLEELNGSFKGCNASDFATAYLCR